jgi:hypothetical protein
MSCPPGKWSVVSAASCSSCEGGYFSSAQDRGTECTDACPVGQFSREAATECSYCAAGTFNGGSALKDECTSLCPLGEVSSAGAASCDGCPEGQFMPLEGQEDCLNCEAGYYCLDIGSFEQVPCPYGYNSAKKSSSCTKCPNADWCTEGKCNLGHKGLACDMCASNWYMGGG